MSGPRHDQNPPRNVPGGRPARKPPKPPGKRRPPVPVPEASQQAGMARVFWGIALGGLAVATVAASVLVILALMHRLDSPKTPMANNTGDDLAQSSSQVLDTSGPPPAPSTRDDEAALGKTEEGRRSLPTNDTNEPDGPADSQPPDSQPSSPQPPGSQPSQAPPPRGPFAEIESKGRMVLLPPLQTALKEPEAGEVARILVDSPASCQLSLLGDEVVLKSGFNFLVDCEDDDDGERRWTISLKNALALDKPQPIGVFTLRDKSLRFAWQPALSGPVHSESLELCLLHLEAEGASIDCLLRQPLKIDPLKIDGNVSQGTIRIPVDIRVRPPVEHLRVRFTPENFPEHRIDPQAVVGLGGICRVRIEDPRTGTPDFLVIELTPDVKRLLAFEFKVHAHLPTSNGDTNSPILIDRKWLEKEKDGWSRAGTRAERNLTDAEEEIREAEGFLKRAKAARSSPDIIKWQGRLARQKEDIETFGERIEQCDVLNEWADDVVDLFNDLKDSARIEVVLYYNIAGQQLTIASSESQPPPGN